jgi:hypothetical protein
MVNWTDHGAPLAYADFSWASDNARVAQYVNKNLFHNYKEKINDEKN